MLILSYGVGLRRSLAEKAVSKPAGTGKAIGFECFVGQVEVSAAGRSLVQRSPTEYVSL